MVFSVSFVHYTLIVITLILNISNADIIWSEKMDLSSIPSSWNISGSGTITPTSSGGSNCPQNTGYCWELTAPSPSNNIINVLYGTAIDTTGYINVQFTGSIKVQRIVGSSNGLCKIQYTLTGQATNFQDIASYDRWNEVDTTISAWNAWLGGSQAADQNSNGIFIQISNERVGGSGIECWFNEFIIEGTLAPTTASPSSPPTTLTPTTSPTQPVPSTSPITASPSSSPITTAPTTSPITTAPTKSPIITPTASPVITSNATQSKVANNYFVDVYRTVPLAVTISNVPQSSLNGDNPSNLPYIAYPLNVCTRNGNNIAATTQYTKYQCTSSGDVVYRCGWGPDETCNNNIVCNQGSVDKDGFDLINNPTNSMGGGSCTDDASTTINYIVVDYYTAFTDSTDGCPGNVYNDVTQQGYKYRETNKFATNVCIAQDDGTYILSKCDLNGGDISQYATSSCNTTPIRTLIDFSTSCSYFDNPLGQQNSERWFRRYSGCIVDGIDIITPTENPTTEPTNNPTTSIPTKTPIVIPTISPTTAEPSISPTKYPSSTPTTPYPSKTPSLNPTLEPTTTRPSQSPHRYTQSPTRSPSPTPTSKLNAGEQLAEDVKTMSFIQIAIIGLLIFYFFIGCYVWCSERNKRLKILSPGSKTRAQRLAAARERNRQRRIQMENVNNTNTQNIVAHSNNHQSQQLLMSEGNPQFRE